MKAIHLERMKDTPAVNFDPDHALLEIEGECYPENAFEFFRQINEAVKGFLEQGKKALTVNLKLIYFNSSSSKCLLDLFEILEDFAKDGTNVRVNWYYQTDDEDLKESGEDFAEDLELVFELIPLD